MSTVGFGRAGMSGKLLETILRSGGTPGERGEGDTALVRQALLLQLALKALDRVIAEYCGATRQRPSYAVLAQYLDELERGLQPSAARGAGAKEIPALLQPQARVSAA